MCKIKKGTYMKTKQVTLVFLVIFLLLLIPSWLFAGAWTQEKGCIYQKLSYSYYFTDKNFGKGGGYDEAAKKKGIRFEFMSRDITWYGEIGAMDNLTFIWSVSQKNMAWAKKRRSDDKKLLSSTHSCLGDLDLAVKYSFSNGPTALSAQFLFKSELFYDNDETIMPGNNQSDYELRLLAGRSLWPWGYVNVEAGYRWRTQAPADEFRYLVEYGLDWKKFYTFVKLNGIMSAHNGDQPSSKQLTGTYKGNPSLGIEYDLGTLDFTVGRKLLYGFALEDYRSDLYGENIADGYTLGLSLVHHWDWW
jgi:hypothetical protein